MKIEPAENENQKTESNGPKMRNHTRKWADMRTKMALEPSRYPTNSEKNEPKTGRKWTKSRKMSRYKEIGKTGNLEINRQIPLRNRTQMTP